MVNQSVKRANYCRLSRQRKVKATVTLDKVHNSRFGLEVKVRLLLGITELAALSLHCIN